MTLRRRPRQADREAGNVWDAVVVSLSPSCPLRTFLAVSHT